jgi:diguanylate cyclase (GGDEF)-like protein
MIDTLKRKLELAGNFPSPPAIALQIIALSRQPDIDIGRVAAAISKDPGLTIKVMRVANSPLYAKRRKSENLRQALVALGLNAATTLALSFSLVATYKSGKGAGIDYTQYWRRALLSASAARTFAATQSCKALEDIFLAAILQDIAVLAIDRVAGDFYATLPAHASHEQWVAHEIASLGSDHAALGAWLMRLWKLPDALCAIVEASHAPAAAEEGTPGGVATRCVALGSECVELLLAEDKGERLASLAAHAESWLGIDAASLGEAMTTIVAEIPEIERLFDTSLLHADVAAATLDEAREMLTLRSIQAFEHVKELEESSEELVARTAALEDKYKRDALTGVFNRGHLDQVLAREFNSAAAGGWPLSVVFVDLDRFKHVNDTYGHPTGDRVLMETAKLMLAVTRDTDCVGRYGGEEFVIVLPGLGSDAADRVCERLLARLRVTQHVVDGGTIRTTASLGRATHCASTPFASVGHLIEAADRCVYVAKNSGRDRLVCFDQRAAAGA